MLCSKILVPYDGSEPGKRALQKALEIAATNDQIELEVVHVAYSPAIWYPEVPIDSIRETITKRGEEQLEELKNTTLKDIANKWRATLLEGPIGPAILEFAKENQCDMIVIGSRGLSGLKEAFLGSVSHYVVHHTNIPVLIVK